LRVLDCDELRTKAANTPGDFSFAEVCKLAECAGFLPGRGDALGRVYVRRTDRETITLQNDDGLARATDVQDVLELF
jgi:hypothetical protein